MHKEIPILLLLLSGSAPACVIASHSGQGSGDACQADVTLHAGDRIRGLDVMAWLAQYWGTHTGTLTWAAGGQTTVDMTTALDPGEPQVTGQCLGGGQILDVYAYGRVVLKSADGGLNDMYTTIVGGPLPDSPLASTNPSAFAGSGLLVTAESPIASHMTIDFSRYSAASNLGVYIDWPVSTAKPRSVQLTYEGYPIQAPGSTDYILVATITFP